MEPNRKPDGEHVSYEIYRDREREFPTRLNFRSFCIFVLFVLLRSGSYHTEMR